MGGIAFRVFHELQRVHGNEYQRLGPQGADWSSATRGADRSDRLLPSGTKIHAHRPDGGFATGLGFRMKEWLQETHAPGFELLRHFLLRFFDSELITTPGQMTPVLIGTTPFAFQWFFL